MSRFSDMIRTGFAFGPTSRFRLPVGSHPGAAGSGAHSAPTSPHDPVSPCVSAVPAQGEAGAETAIHGTSGVGSSSSGAPLPGAAEAGEAPRPCLSCGGAHSVAASPAADPSGGRPSRVSVTGSSPTRLCHTELGWVRTTRLADGGWYLSMRDGAHQVACFLSNDDVQGLFCHGERP